MFRDASQGYEWDTTGPAILEASLVHPAPHEIALLNGQVAPPVAAAPFTNGIYTIVSGADIVQVAATGHVRLSDGNLNRVLHGRTDFCTRTGGCDCPPGSSYQGPSLTPLAAHADLALTGGPEGTKVTLYKSDNFVFGTAFDFHHLLASGDYKAFPGYGDQSFLHLRDADAGDLAEILVRRGRIWFVVSVEYNYPSAEALARSGRSALAACKALTKTVLSRW